MKLVSKIILDEDEQEILDAFATLLDRICSNSGDCSECSIAKVCKYHGNFPDALELLLSQCDTDNPN